MEKKFLSVLLPLMMLFTLISCGKTEQAPSNTISEKSSFDGGTDHDYIEEYVAEHYGFCDSLLHGVYTSTVTHQMNTASLDSEIIELDVGYKSGAVFYKIVSDKNSAKNIVCVYLKNSEGKVSLMLDYFDLDEQGFSSKSHTMTIAEPHMKSIYYCLIGSDYLTVVELSEICEGFYDGDYYLARDIDEYDVTLSSTEYYYTENISVYELDNDFSEVMKMERNITPPNPNETNICTISADENIWAYASGVSYTNENATLLTTEQEFCDKTNELLHGFSIDEIKVTRTSWQNRWYRLEIDENDIPDNMVKVDFSCSPGISDGNGHVSSEVTIAKNAKKETYGELQDEAPDNPVSYGSTENNNQNTVIMPDNIPSSIDASQLQELEYFNLDGFWYSSDMHYVMSINVGSQFWNTFRYVDLQGSDGIKNGSVYQTSSYSINLKPNEDNEKNFEVFAVNGQLISAEITFIRASDNVSNNILGSWQNGDKTYRFDDDGTYTVLMKNDSYWGYYFPIDESRIVLGVYSNNLKKVNYSFKCFNYTLDTDSFVIEGMASLVR